MCSFNGCFNGCSLINETNRLRKEINSFLGKGMLNIDLKVFIEKKWHAQNFNFLSLKNLSLGQFLGSSNSCRYHWIFKLLVVTKNQRSGSKTVCGFSIIFILKGIMIFFMMNYEVKESMLFIETNIWSLIKTRGNRKWKIPHTVLERWTLCFNWYKNCKLKVKLWRVGARKK